MLLQRQGTLPVNPAPVLAPDTDTDTAFSFDLNGVFNLAEQAGNTTVQQMVTRDQPAAEMQGNQASAHQAVMASLRTGDTRGKFTERGSLAVKLPPLSRERPEEVVMRQLKAGKLNSMSIAQRTLAFDVGMLLHPADLATALAAAPPDAATTAALTAWCATRMDSLLATLPEALSTRRNALAAIVGHCMAFNPDAMVKSLDAVLAQADAASLDMLLGDFASRVLEKIPDESLPTVLSSMERHATDRTIVVMQKHATGLLNRTQARMGDVASAAFKQMKTVTTAGLRKDVPMPEATQLAALIADRPVMTQRTALVVWMAAVGDRKNTVSADPDRLKVLQDMDKTARTLFLCNKGTPGVTKQMFLEMQKTCESHGLVGLAELSGACAAKLPKAEVLRQWLGVTSATLAREGESALGQALVQMRADTAKLRNTHVGPAGGAGLINESIQHFHAASKEKAPELKELVVLADELKSRSPTLEGSMVQWLKTIDYVKGGISPERPDLLERLAGMETEARRLQRRHQDYGEKAAALLKAHALQLAKDHPDAPISRIAMKLSSEISPEDLGRPVEDFHAALHNNHFGRFFENQLIHAMLRDPPATVQAAMKEFGAAYAELMQSEAWQKDGNLDRLLGNLEPVLSADNFWCMKAPGLVAFRAATNIDDKRESFMEFLSADKNNGVDCAALLYLAHRISEYCGEGARAPWFEANAANYARLVSPHKSRLEIEIAKDARATPEEGIGLLHQSGIDMEEPWSSQGANPATGYKPNLNRGKTSTAVVNSLQREVAYVAGASGVTSSIMHIVDHFKKNTGHHIDVGAAALGTAMFLNTSHSINEVLFAVACLNEPLGLGLDLGTANPKQFVADYQQLLPRLAGSDASHMSTLLDKALDATVAEFRKTGPAMLLNEAQAAGL